MGIGEKLVEIIIHQNVKVSSKFLEAVFLLNGLHLNKYLL